jgi:integrase
MEPQDFSGFSSGMNLGENPLRGQAKLQARPIQENVHRPLTDEELAKFLEVAPPDRRLQYETALTTGFRVDELRHVRVMDLDIFGPSLFLRGDYAKNRKDCHQPITRELAAALATQAVGKDKQAPLLDIATSKAWKHFKADLAAAGIESQTPDGKATWHSLRKCFDNALIKSGLDLKTLMTLMRQSSASLTLETYASADPKRLRAGVEAAAGYIREAVAAARVAPCVAQGSDEKAEGPSQVAVPQRVKKIS